MGIKTQTGFTIIEVMLFLAITGVLTAAVLVGSGVSINQQRYRDSITSLQSYIQQQYNQVANITNGRAGDWTCDGNGNVTQTSGPSGGEPRGTSDCVVLGRVITVDSTGTQLTTSNVVGYHNPNGVTQTSDLAELTTNYKLGIVPFQQDTTSVNWSAQIVKPKTTTPMPLSILIIRSPLSGVTLTFSQTGALPNLNAMLTQTNESTQRDLCVNADIGAFVGRRMEVRINPFASSQSAIQVPTEGDSVCN